MIFCRQDLPGACLRDIFGAAGFVAFDASELLPAENCKCQRGHPTIHAQGVVTDLSHDTRVVNY